MKRRHSMPFGAEVVDGGAVRFRLWAPAAARVDLCLERNGMVRELPLQPVGAGWYELVTAAAAAGSRYRFRIDGGLCVPDPASRFQPDDVQGPSQVIDPHAWEWQDDGWRGRPWEETVLYELHVDTFTPRGTFRGVQERLEHLLRLGVTAIELMPVADFPGERNWGYDGVLPFAPDSRYGTPEQLKELVQSAHQHGLMVFLDVVYNHFGPEGNYLHLYAPQFFTERHHTPWGAAINYDGPERHWVRQFFIHNALYWLEEYRFDGLRLDAVHAIMDDSRPDILIELAEAVHDGLGRMRHIHLVLENDANAARYLQRGESGLPHWYVAQWNDDFHHALHVLGSGEHGGYYQDYRRETAALLGRCLTEGFAYQGEASAYRQGAPRGEPSRHLPPTAFVAFLQNHDQVGNRAFGERAAALMKPEALRALAAVYLLAPSIPLLFMGEEWGTTRPFLFFCDFGPELGPKVTEGRRREFARFPEFQDPEARARIPDPEAVDTFLASRLDWAEPGQPEHREWLDLYRRLLDLRRREIVPRLSGIQGAAAECRVLGERALQARWVLGDGSTLHLLANLGDADWSGGVQRPAGELLHSTSARLASGRLPAWTTAWFLDRREP
ncbi:MAG: malto-oligosyltrehalose trehalohydrolase [Gammaproteobacteria bacterium]